MTQAKALDYIVGADAAMVLDYALGTQAVIKGINKLAPPGMTRQTITIDEFRNDFARVFTGGGSYSDMPFGGNLVLGDNEGQGRLKQYVVDRTKLIGRQLLVFLDYNHFFTTDLANDPSSAMQIAEFTSGEVGKNDAFPITGKIVPNGKLAIYSAHMTEVAVPTLAFVNGGANNDTITDSGDGFITAGFYVGQTLLTFDSTSNDNVNTTIIAVAAGELTLASKGLMNAEPGVEEMEIHGGS